MATTILNTLFYPDITNIIMDYLMVSVISVKRNKFRTLKQFLGLWRNYEKWHTKYVKSEPFNSLDFLIESYESKIFGNRYKRSKKTFKLK